MLFSQTGVHRDKLANYVEVDFPEVTSKKAMSIRKSKELSTVLGNAADIHVCQHFSNFTVDIQAQVDYCSSRGNGFACTYISSPACRPTPLAIHNT